MGDVISRSGIMFASPHAVVDVKFEFEERWIAWLVFELDKFDEEADDNDDEPVWFDLNNEWSLLNK